MKAPLLVALLLAPLAGRAAAYVPENGGQPVAVLLQTWHDATRDRDVPVKIYYPAKASGPCPVIVFSHGLGGSREGYEYLGRRWAGCGYICVHLQHIGSDDSVWKDHPALAMAEMKQAVADPQNAVNRAGDIHFAIDRVLALNRETGSPLKGLIDPAAIGFAGHSFGAWTTLVAVGERTPAGDWRDRRIQSAIAMSAPVPAGETASGRTFANIDVPVFHMTGTLDNSPIGDTAAAQRRIPYDQSHAPGTCLLILNGADHMTFSGHIMPLLQRDDSKFHALILAGSTAFWDATLRHDAGAKAWLYGGGFAKLVGTMGTFEQR